MAVRYRRRLDEILGERRVLVCSGDLNYNMIDGKRNNTETPKEAKPGKDKISLLERLKEKQQLLISGTRKEDKEKKSERDLP